MNEELQSALRWHLEPFRRPRPEHHTVELQVYIREEDEHEEPPMYSYFRGAGLEFRHQLVNVLLKQILWDINQYLPHRARDFLFLHAGSVAGAGGALLLPAPPNFGKSSTVAALLRRGFGYLSDEMGVIDPVTERAYPYPRYLALDQTAVDVFPGLEDRLDDLDGRGGDRFGRYVRAEDLGAQVAAPTSISAFAFLSEDREGPPRLDPVTKAEAVEAMARTSMNLYRYEGRGVVLLSRVAANADAFRLTGGSALDRAEMLADRFLP